MAKYSLEKNPDAYSNISSLFTYFHGIGVLVQKELIDVKLVTDLMGHTISRTWEKYESVIQEARRRDSPTEWEHVEYLYNKVRPLAFQPSFP